MQKKKNRLFELLVIGGGVWISSACGGELTTDSPRPTTQTTRRLLPDGGVPDGGELDPPYEGNGSGFW